MKRLLFFVFYDKDGIVDTYIDYLLNDFSKSIEKIVIIINGKCNIEGRKLFEKYSSDIFLRENQGYDAGAYKAAVFEYFGLEKIKLYDEVIFMNDTFFGPFYPSQIIFQEMEQRNIDFWGITLQETVDLGYGRLPRYIQSYFIAFRRKVVESHDFKEFWESMGTPKDYLEVCKKFENRLMSFFVEKGYKYSVLVDDKILSSIDGEKSNYNHYWFLPYTLIKYHKMPFLKIKPFISLDIDNTMQEELVKALEYIQDEFGYSKSWVFEHVLRKHSIDRLVFSANLFKIISTEKNVSVNMKSASIIIFIENMKTLYYWNSTISLLAREADLKIITNSEEIYRQITDEKELSGVCSLEKTANKYNAWSYQIDKIPDEKIMAYLHDDMINEEKSAAYISYITLYLETMFFNQYYITRILNEFETNDQLGLLMSFPAKHAQYWTERHLDKIETKPEKLRRILNIEMLDQDQFKKIKVENGIWIRCSVVKKLCKKFKSEGLSLESLFIWFAQFCQTEGYFSEYITTCRWAEVGLKNSMFADSFSKEHILFTDDMKISNYQDYRKQLEVWGLFHKLEQYEKVYIYGAGVNAKKTYEIFKSGSIKISAFIVSAYGNNPDKIEGIPVCILDEIALDDTSAVVLCLNTNNTKQVLPLLLGRINEENIFSL